MTAAMSRIMLSVRVPKTYWVNFKTYNEVNFRRRPSECRWVGNRKFQSCSTTQNSLDPWYSGILIAVFQPKSNLNPESRRFREIHATFLSDLCCTVNFTRHCKLALLFWSSNHINYYIRWICAELQSPPSSWIPWLGWLRFGEFPPLVGR